MQDYAKRRVHIWSLKFNTKLSRWHPSGVATVRDQQKTLVPFKKEIRVLFMAPLFLVSGVESPLIFFIQKIKKKKKKLNTKYMTELFYSHWLKSIHIWQIEYYMTLGPSYKLPKIHDFLSKLQSTKNKNKDKA